MRERQPIVVRPLCSDDITSVRAIYNQGIEDRVATLEADPKSDEAVASWLIGDRAERYEVVVAVAQGRVVGWASLNPYSHRCAYDGVAELSIYVEREMRGRGVGEQLLAALEERARGQGFHKIVLFALPFNAAGRRLYGKRGFREVGIFREQGRLDGRFVDVVAMEKILARDS